MALNQRNIIEDREMFLLSSMIVICVCCICGCSTSLKNISILDESYFFKNPLISDQNFNDAKLLLNVISCKNRKFAYEIGKIPELLDGISKDEIMAIKRLVYCYLDNELVFDRIFQEMYAIGLPEDRKYCSTLQAFLWLFIDKNYDEIEDLLYNYSTESLLYKAWVLENNMHYHRWCWRTQQAHALFHSCTDSDLKKKIVNYYKKNKGAVDYIISMVEKVPEKFGHTYIAYESVLIKQQNRWNNHKIVYDRLNAPELIHFFIYNNYFYEPNEYSTPKKTFYSKYGNSKALAELGKLLLDKSGYKTFFITIKDESTLCRKEHAGTGIFDENGNYVLVVDMPKGKEISVHNDQNALEKYLRNGNCMPPPKRQFRFALPKNFFQKNI
ncbi:hypothetical protein [Desulfosarcina ovata]|nr:hypothetical protein [Desulfosarcina ovata]